MSGPAPTPTPTPTPPPAARPARHDFLNSKPPPNYVAGLGRDATGFTTRSDIGPARAAPDLPDRSASTAVGRGSGEPPGDYGGDEEKGCDENQQTFDDFEGNDAGLFSNADHDDDVDREADAVWESIDRRMDSRRKVRREVRLTQEIERYGASNRKITEQFADLKRKPTDLSAQEWESIPDTGDYSLHNKKKRLESSVPVPDALLEKARQEQEHVKSRAAGGTETPWLAGDMPVAGAILQDAYAAIPNSEAIWLDAFKLEFENNEPERARTLLAKARERGGTERIWMKSAIVERELGNVGEERRLLEEGLKLFPSFFKLWLMFGHMEDRVGHGAKAKEVYENGLKHCPSCIPLWLSLASLEEKISGLSTSRAVLTMARKKNPAAPELCLAAIRAESRHGNKKEADALLAKALQECPTSGILWAAAIEMAPRPQRKAKSSDAIKLCDHDPHVMATVAKIFWCDRKTDKARSWFNRAVTLAPDIGDFWALYYKFELQHGDMDTQNDVMRRCVAAEPKHGEKWQAIRKAVENSRQSVEALLKKAVVALDAEENPNAAGA